MSYDLPLDHHSMVFDHHRNTCYGDALRQVVTDETTVMDLGAGLGVLGLMAAKLGAREVHLVEPAPVIHVARELAAENGLANVHCHPVAVEDLELEAPVDVMVSVFTGNFLLGEDLLPALFNARDRFLAPGGTLIPDRARMRVAPVSVAAYYSRYIDAWRLEGAGGPGTIEVDMSAARKYAANSTIHDTAEEFQPSLLAAAGELCELDFHTATEAACDGQLEFTIERAGTCHGWLGWFDMRLGERWLSTGPEDPATHWRQVLMPLEEPLELSAGDRIGFELKRPRGGEWTWTTRAGDRVTRQSSFLSRPVTFKDFGKGAA